uniref:Insulin-like growth factor-binding protein complex acid labile subunit n=1 Tax=Anoplophora glabripennis TaxID=217634 RepID=V5GLJ8_ANOGL
MMWWHILYVIPVLRVSYAVELVSAMCPDLCQCDNLITDCRYGSLTELPAGINPNVISLDLSYNSFQSFPEGLRDFQSLKYLNISNNKISTLGHSDFAGLENLERLDLSYNQFHDWKDIHSATFGYLKILTYLDISNNALRSIPQYSSHLVIPSMEILKLNNCSMRSVPVQTFKSLPNLKELHMTDNPIRIINDSFELSNVKYIDLSGCDLQYIGDHVFQALPLLETLILKNNDYLKKISCNSESLLYLDLSGCTLETVPTGNLRALTFLNLQGNFLREIPDRSFTNFPNLLKLNLSYNAISVIQDNAFRGLDNVNIIDLSLNKLTVLSEKTFLSTIALITLNLSHNYINSIDSITSTSLKTLDVSYCEIYAINRFSLGNLPKLIELSLARNFLSSLPDGWTADRLVYLDVSGCRIKTINNHTFEQMFYLRHINLSGNRLTTIDPSFFPQALYVKVDDNQWRCDCPKLKSMFEWLIEYNERVDRLICDSPERYEGKAWHEACQDEWYPTPQSKDHLWWYSVGVIVTMVLLLVAVVAMRKMHQIKESRLREIEETRRAQEREALERMHRLQRERREEENRNAPDPREVQRPPSYNEALLLPRLDSSYQNLSGSMHSLNSRQSGSNPDVSKKGRPKRKRRRRKSDSSEGRRASRVVVDSDTSDLDTQLRTQAPLESDF